LYKGKGNITEAGKGFITESYYARLPLLTPQSEVLLKDKVISFAQKKSPLK
jgi:hypothetical protein